MFVPHNATVLQENYNELEKKHPECLFIVTKLHRRNKRILDYFFITLPSEHKNSIACIDQSRSLKAIEINMNHNASIDVVAQTFC